MLQPISSEEKEWLQSLKAGKQTALQQIFNHYYRYLVVTAFNITGDNAEWKKAQKKAAKNIISDVINNKKACFIQCCIINVCILNDSFITSLNQLYNI